MDGKENNTLVDYPKGPLIVGGNTGHEEVRVEPVLNLKFRFKQLFIKMLSLKFGAFMIQITLGIIWFIYLLKTEIANASVWGIWSGYMVGAFTVYTAGNVKAKTFSLPFSAPLMGIKQEEDQQ